MQKQMLKAVDINIFANFYSKGIFCIYMICTLYSLFTEMILFSKRTNISDIYDKVTVKNVIQQCYLFISDK